MARSLNSRCNFENRFFSCDLPGDAVLLVVKIKTKTGNHTLVEDTEKWTEKFRLWKKPTKDGESSPRGLPGVLTPRKNNNSMTSDSGPCPSSLTETEYKPKFFNEPEYLSSDKENITPTESVTSPSPKNLSLEEGINSNKIKATSWEASVARNVVTTPRASSPYPRQTSTLEDLELNTDNIIDVTNFLERLANDQRSPWPKCNFTTHTMTQGHCPTPQNSPIYLPMTAVAATPTKPHRTEIWGILPNKKRVPCRWPACLRKQPLRITFKNNDIYMVNDEESDTYEEPKERHPRVMYKLKVSKDPTSKNMPH